MFESHLSTVDYDLVFDDELRVPWDVVCVQLDEALSEPFDMTITATTVVDLDPQLLLGAHATLMISRGHHDPRPVFGVVAQIDDLGDTGGGLTLRFMVVPAFALLRQRVNSRIWQDRSVLDIVAEVLDEGLASYGRRHELGAVTRGARVRDYCVQYCESDLDFVSRLLEEEGISYCFTHDVDLNYEVLTLFDANEQYPSLAAFLDDDVLPLILHNPDEADVESVHSIAWTGSLTSTSVLRRDFDWRAPEALLTSEVTTLDERGRTRRLYAHTQRRLITDDLRERASDLQRAAALTGAVCRGRSNATALRPGLRFRLSGHEREAFDRSYIVTAVHHCGDARGPQYVNEFDCVPDDREIRPYPRTPKPRIHGPQTAIVTGDEEIHTDVHGRVQVQFSWEETPSYAAESSCWIHCSQSWAGAGWGAHFIPRVGMQVVVEFIDGDPDQPLVTGCVYDGSRAHPFQLPDTKTQSGWRTQSSPGSQGFNELRFEDAAGQEEIYVHAQRDHRAEIENDQTTTVGSNQSTSVGATQSISVGGARSVSVGGSESVSVGAGRSVSVGGSESVSVGAGRNVNVGGSYSMSSASLSANADTGTITMSDTLTLECGPASIVLDKSGGVTIKGTKIVIEGETLDSKTSSDTVIVGAMIKLNPPEPSSLGELVMEGIEAIGDLLSGERGKAKPEARAAIRAQALAAQSAAKARAGQG